MIASGDVSKLLQYKAKLTLGDNEVLKRILGEASLSQVEDGLRRAGLATFAGLNADNAAQLLERVPELVIKLPAEARSAVFDQEAITLLPPPQQILEKFLRKVFPSAKPWQLEILIDSLDNLSPLSPKEILSSYLAVFESAAIKLGEQFSEGHRNQHGDVVIKLLQVVVTEEGNAADDNALSGDLGELLSQAQRVLTQHASVKRATKAADTIFALLK